MRWLIVLVALSGCTLVPYKKVDHVAAARQKLDKAKVDRILTEAFRRTPEQHGACIYGVDPLTTIQGDRTARVSYPLLTLSRARSTNMTQNVGGVTATVKSDVTLVPVEVDLREVKRLVLTRTDGSCGTPGKLYRVGVALSWSSFAMHVTPEHLDDVLAALTFERPAAEIVYGSDGPLD